MPQPSENRFRHRDLNWLSFNERVLQEAADKINPLYDRMKFLAIFSSNLDEYFRVRVSQLRQMKRVKKSIRKKLALKPSRITKQIIEEVKKQQNQFGDIYKKQIIPELAANNIFLLEADHYDEKQKAFAEDYFQKNIQQHLDPMLINLDEENELCSYAA